MLMWWMVVWLLMFFFMNVSISYSCSCLSTLKNAIFLSLNNSEQTNGQSKTTF